MAPLYRSSGSDSTRSNTSMAEIHLTPIQLQVDKPQIVGQTVPMPTSVSTNPFTIDN